MALLTAILEKRRKFFSACTAFRLCHFELDPRLTVDYYAGYLLFIYYRDYPHARLPQLAAAFAEELTDLRLPFYGAVKKFRPQNLSHAQHEEINSETAPALLLGQPPPPRFLVREFSLQFMVSMHTGFSTGLFLDIKNARQRVRQLAQEGDQVLNLFSYTGGFSLAAALAGASRVIEVDSNARWLNWSKENQQCNGVTVVRQRREDAVKFLRKQKLEVFDLVICDPPTYSSQKSGARFNVGDGFREMRGDLQRVLRPGGYLLASTNARSLAREDFFEIFARGWERVEEILISDDFAEDDYLKIGLFRKREK